MTAELDWYTTQNTETSTLRTGDVQLAFGDVVEVRGHNNKWIVTYVTGSDREWSAVFMGQDPLPLGPMEWRIIYRSPRSAIGRVATPKTEKTVSKPANIDVKTPKMPVAQDAPDEPSRFSELLRRGFEIIGILLAVIAVIIGLVIFAH